MAKKKGCLAVRRSVHEGDLAREAAEEAKRAAKRAKKHAHMAAERDAQLAQQDAELQAAQTPAAGGSMEVELPKISRKQKIGVRKSRGSIKKPNLMMRKTLQKMERKKRMEM